MEKLYLLPQAENWYKANLHCHTTISDGALTPEEVKQVYKEHGYSVIAFTDHCRYCWHRELDDSEFLSIAAFEADMNEPARIPDDFSRVKTYHINFYDCNPEEGMEWKQDIALPEKRYGDIPYLNNYVEQMSRNGFLACYNHPYWSLQDYNDYKDLRGFWAMEIYNHGCEVDGLYGFNPQSYDEMLRTGHRLLSVATDDNHNRGEFNTLESDSFGGYIMIGAKELSYAAVMDALKTGDFYYSMDPEILEVSVCDNQLYIKTSPVEKIYVIQEGRDCYRKQAMPGTTITEAAFTLSGKEGYIRVEIRDEKGRYAGTNAFHMDDVMRRLLDLK